MTMTEVIRLLKNNVEILTFLLPPGWQCTAVDLKFPQSLSNIEVRVVFRVCISFAEEYFASSVSCGILKRDEGKYLGLLQ